MYYMSLQELYTLETAILNTNAASSNKEWKRFKSKYGKPTVM